MFESMPSTVKELRAVIGKASVLLEAMPYLQSFREKIFVIKAGGAALQLEDARKQLLQDILFLSLAGIRPVLVHGGGAEISQKLRTEGRTPEFVEGLRVTDEATLSVVAQTLWRVNRQLVSELKRLGGNASGLSGERDRILEAVRLTLNGRDIGFVGKIRKVNPQPIHRFLQAGKIPVVIPLARGSDGQTYNVNADQAAACMASALKAEKFVLITDVKGILKDGKDPRSFISTASAHQVERFIQQGIIKGGMIPKTRACIQALRLGVKKTHMIDLKIPHGLLLEIFTDRGIGTEIVVR